MKKELLAAISLALGGCSAKAQAKNLTGDLKRDEPELKIPDADTSGALLDFSLALLRQEQTAENVLLSGYSVAEALVMAANGAGGETRTQMEAVFGMDIDTLNAYLYYVIRSIPQGEKNTLYTADSIWYRKDERLCMNQEFLQKNKDYYNAELYESPFDESTKIAVNKWVNEKTEGRIRELLKNPPDSDTIMYLINALSFTGEWDIPYKKSDVSEGEFTSSSGEKETTEYMFHTEDMYLKMDHGEGIVKPYYDGEYYFAAIIPEEGMSIEDFLKSLDGEKLQEALQKPEETLVDTYLPKFAFAYETHLVQSLQNLGMIDAFDGSLADFTPMATYEGENICISDVIHKTMIQVDEDGTKAAAVTAVVMEKCMSMMPQDTIELRFDRPFFFLIAEGSTHTPLFIGIVNSVK